MRRLAIVAAALSVGACGGPAFDSATCKTFMVGTWAGAGTVEMGRSVKTEVLWVLKADGTFANDVKYEKAEGGWEDQKTAGTYVAEPGEEKGQCKISQTVVSDMGSGTGVGRVTVEDKDTIVSFGVTLKRQP
ncbi:hypothetical protein sos41_16910 [Alphaproteobacteria bacterium SO-S41]|nr:hypothetical protein sos41_16910 [Alphaproteobacteria bacterium SO-S41]